MTNDETVVPSIRSDIRYQSSHTLSFDLAGRHHAYILCLYWAFGIRLLLVIRQLSLPVFSRRNDGCVSVFAGIRLAGLYAEDWRQYLPGRSDL